MGHTILLTSRVVACFFMAISSKGALRYIEIS